MSVTRLQSSLSPGSKAELEAHKKAEELQESVGMQYMCFSLIWRLEKGVVLDIALFLCEEILDSGVSSLKHFRTAMNDSDDSEEERQKGKKFLWCQESSYGYTRGVFS